MAAHSKSLPSLRPATSRKPPIIASRIATKPRASHEPIAAAKAKTHFLQLLDQVERDRQPITITKRGRIVAQIVPATKEPEVSVFDQVFGSMKGSIKITGDIVSPDWESWGPEWR